MKGGWNLQVEVEGLEHISRGLEAGRGVILWGMFFCGTSVVKAALWRAGVRLTHLSRVYHGAPSLSRLALTVLAPMYCRAENRYLAKRVVLPLGTSVHQLYEAMDVLKANGCLSVNGENTAQRRNVTANFLGGRVEFGVGAPWLARRSGAALLTVYARRRGRFHYQVVIAPMDVDRSLEMSEVVRAAVEQYARRLENLVLQQPADWQCWHVAERLPFSPRGLASTVIGAGGGLRVRDTGGP